MVEHLVDVVGYANQTIKDYTDTSLQNSSTNGTTAIDEELQKLKDIRIKVLFAYVQIVGPLILIFGFVGNFLNIIVLSRKWMRSSTNYYLTVLAVYDTMYLLLHFVSLLHYWDGITLSISYYRAYAYLRPLCDTFNALGIWITVTFTIERYIGVCFPMRGRLWCTPRRAIWVIVGVTVICTALMMPTFFEFEKNPPKRVNIRTDFANTVTYRIGYNWFLVVMFTFLPLCLLFVFNIMLMRSVAKANQIRLVIAKASSNHQNKKQQSEQQRITIMLISVVVVFLVCQTPAGIHLVYGHLSEFTSEKDSYIFRIAAIIVNLLTLINAAINFILYSYFSNRFRKTCRRLFCTDGPLAVNYTETHTQMTHLRKSSPFMTPLRTPTHQSPNHSPVSAKNAERKTNGHQLCVPDVNGYTQVPHKDDV